MLKKTATIVLLFSLILSFTPAYAANDTTVFTDVSGHWGRTSIEFVNSRAIIKGYGDGRFGPDDKVTVEQYIIMLVRALGIDVPNGLDNCVAAAQELGLIANGSEFMDYKAPITRADMARLSIRAYEGLNPNVTYPSYLEAYKGLVEDYDLLGEDVKTNVLKCVEQGLITGGSDGNFTHEGISTRAQAAAVIHRLLSPVERETKKPVFAEPDPEFEAFMATEEAAEYCSTLRIDQVIDGRIIWNSRYGEDYMSSGEYGTSLLPTYNNRDANKIAYNLLKVMVTEAQKTNNYVMACFLSRVSDGHKIAYFRYYRTVGAGRKVNSNFAFETCLWLYPHKINKENLDQKALTLYEWDISNLFDNEDSRTKDLSAIRYQTDEYKIPLQKAFKAVYGEQTGQQFFAYTMTEYNTGKNFVEKNKRYENWSITAINGIEVQNFTYGSPHFGTGK